MYKLMWANGRRMLRDKAFRIGCVCLIGVSVYFPVSYHMDLGDQAIPNNYFFYFSLFIGVFVSVLCSLYLGTEYSEGTMRNKLIAGHTRRNIYLANLIVCTLASLFAMAVYIVVESLVGIPLNGRVQMDLPEILIRFLVSGCMVLSFSSIFTLLSMLHQNKAAASVINVLLFFALMLTAVYLLSRLSESEFIENYVYIDNLGNLVPGDPMPNPLYLTKTPRAVCEFLCDLLPTGQGLQMCTQIFFRWGRMMGCNVGITAGTTLLGIFAFQRKDIK